MFHCVIMLVLSLILVPDRGLADYPCICNYHTARDLYGSPSTFLMPVGTLYKSDCKAQVLIDNLKNNWVAVAVSHRIVYLKEDYLIHAETCQGNPDPNDLVSSSVKPSTLLSTITSHRQSTTSSLQPMFTTSSWFKPTHKSNKPTYKAPFSASSTIPTSLKPKPLITGDTSLCSGILHEISTRWDTFQNQYGDHCLLMVISQVIWEEAEWQCRQNNGHLVSIHNQAENDFMKDFLNNNTYFPLWIGLNDNNNEGTFQWAADPNKQVTYTNWAPDYQTGQHWVEDCVNIGPDGLWDDRRCGHYNTEDNLAAKYGYICQFDIKLSQSSMPVG